MKRSTTVRGVVVGAVAMLLAASLVGRPPGGVTWWAWPVAAGSDRSATVRARATLALGVAASAVRAHRRRAR